MLQAGEAPGIQPPRKLVDRSDAGQYLHGCLHRSPGDGTHFGFLVSDAECSRTALLPGTYLTRQGCLPEREWSGGTAAVAQASGAAGNGPDGCNCWHWIPLGLAEAGDRLIVVGGR
ncbi:hypothetical protein NtRootA9_24170 [Arthrobacter sp. NtRootA9]|nr:hypothetical protein NtRootA9_24170 [Arthrobacter sp. NtRootA9]